MATATVSLLKNPAPYLRMAAVVEELNDRAEVLPCAGSNWPTSDDVAERAFAAENWCPGCPLKEPCRDAGQQEQWGIWGGIDRDPKTAKRARAAA